MNELLLNAGAFLFSILFETYLQSLKSIVLTVFVLELVKCSTPRKLYPAKFLWPWKLQHQFPRANQRTGFYMITASVMKELNTFFWSNYHLSIKKLLICEHWVFPFFMFFFLLKWSKQEIINTLSENPLESSP